MKVCGYCGGAIAESIGEHPEVWNGHWCKCDTIDVFPQYGSDGSIKYQETINIEKFRWETAREFVKLALGAVNMPTTFNAITHAVDMADNLIKKLQEQK